MSRHPLILAALLIASVALPRPASATVEATPFVGAMIPANSQYLDTSGFAIIRMQTHTVYGLSLGAAVTPSVGAEVVLGTGTGKMEIFEGSALIPLSTTLFIADLRGTLRLVGNDESRLAAVLGIGYTDFNNGYFDLAHEERAGTFIGRATGIAGVELRHQVADRARLSMVLVDRVHDGGIGLNFSSGAVRKTQNDLMATLGLTFGL